MVVYGRHVAADLYDLHRRRAASTTQYTDADADADADAEQAKTVGMQQIRLIYASDD